MKNKMIFLDRVKGVDFYIYTPTIFHQYNKCYKKKEEPEYWNSIRHRIRMFVQHITYGYSVVYMFSENQILGHIVVSRGGRDFLKTTKDDIVLGPIWINPNFRGRGFGTIGIDFVLNSKKIKYNRAFERISPTNVASIRTVEKNNFKFFGKVSQNKNKVFFDSNGQLAAYVYYNKEEY